ANWHHAKIQRDVALERNDAMLSAAEEKLRQTFHELQNAERSVDELTIRAGEAGTVVATPCRHQDGKYVDRGQSLATQIVGDRMIRVYLTSEELMHAVATPGDRVRFATTGDSGRCYQGAILNVSAASQTQFDDLALTQLAGGSLVVDPATQRAQQTLYAIDIEASDLNSDVVRNHYEQGRVWVMFDRRYEPLGLFAYRHIRDFVSQLNLN
ncbi:MAG: hypothetical protein AAF539_15120, partial [Planctomycetota bacterium]